MRWLIFQCNCTAYHFACCLPEEVGEVIRKALVDAGIDTTIKDVVSLGWVYFHIFTLPKNDMEDKFAF